MSEKPKEPLFKLGNERVGRGPDRDDLALEAGELLGLLAQWAVLHPLLGSPGTWLAGPERPMIEIRLGWFAPHRAGGWRPWVADFTLTGWRTDPTVSADVCLLGLTLCLVVGWGTSNLDEVPS